MIRTIVLLIILGLPVALVLAWMFELTPEGIKRTETADAMPAAAKPKKYVWIYIVLIGGAISIGLIFIGRYTARNTASVARTEAATASIVPQKSIAVLPFENLSDDKSNAYFAEGIQDEILTRLVEDCRPEGDLPHLDSAVQKRAGQPARNRSAARRRQCHRRQRAENRQCRARECAADPRGHRRACLGRELQPQARRRLRGRGRSGQRHRGTAQPQAFRHRTKSGGRQTDGERRRLRCLPARPRSRTQQLRLR